jgi:hypothetical protein
MGPRINQPLQQAIAGEALDVYRRYKGTSWTDYRLAADLMLGIAQWGLHENYRSDGTDKWWNGSAAINGSTQFWRPYNGFTIWTLTDVSHTCPDGTPIPGTIGEPTVQFPGEAVWDTRSVPQSASDVWGIISTYFAATGKRTPILNPARTHLIRQAVGGSIRNGNFGVYRVALAADALASTTAQQLQDVPFTVSHLGAGNYRLTFTSPASTTALRVKWANKQIVPVDDGLLGYDPFTMAFAKSPDTYTPWFAANIVPTEPTPTPGTQQTFDIDTGGLTTLSTANFSVMAMADEGDGGGEPPPSSTRRSMRGGSMIRNGRF